MPHTTETSTYQATASEFTMSDKQSTNDSDCLKEALQKRKDRFSKTKALRSTKQEFTM